MKTAFLKSRKSSSSDFDEVQYDIPERDSVFTP